MPETSTPTGTQKDGWEGRLDRARNLEIQIYDTLTQALKDGDVLVVSKLQAAHVAAIKEIAGAEATALQARTASRELIAAATVREIMREVLVPLRQAVDMLPILERANCNPAQPEVAEKALKLWRDRLLVRLSTMETRF